PHGLPLRDAGELHQAGDHRDHGDRATHGEQACRPLPGGPAKPQAGVVGADGQRPAGDREMHQGGMDGMAGHYRIRLSKVRKPSTATTAWTTTTALGGSFCRIWKEARKKPPRAAI